MQCSNAHVHNINNNNNIFIVVLNIRELQAAAREALEKLALSEAKAATMQTGRYLHDKITGLVYMYYTVCM